MAPSLVKEAILSSLRHKKVSVMVSMCVRYVYNGFVAVSEGYFADVAGLPFHSCDILLVPYHQQLR